MMANEIKISREDIYNNKTIDIDSNAFILNEGFLEIMLYIYNKKIQNKKGWKIMKIKFFVANKLPEIKQTNDIENYAKKNNLEIIN